MEVSIARLRELRAGKVTICKLEPEFRRNGKENQETRIDRSLYTWRPAGIISRDMVSEFPVALECRSINGGQRQLSPHDGRLKFILGASVGGQALLRQLQEGDKEVHFSYGAMRLLYQKAPLMPEFVNRALQRIEDLYIPRAARVADEIDVLPDTIGHYGNGPGHRWTVGQLVAHGRDAAAAAGVESPSDEEIIRFGLLAAARRNPIDIQQLDADEATGLLRLILFGLGPCPDKISDITTDEVVGRLLDAVEKHIDHSTEDFDSWFFEEADNVVHQISKRKRPGGEIERVIVRQVMLETVFRAYRYVGDCVDLQAKAMADAMKPKLDADERAAFGAIYEKSSYLGDIPLLFLYDQFPLAPEAFSEVLENPSDAAAAGTLLRVLQFQAEMVGKKRASERRYQKQRHHRNQKNASAVVFALIEDPATSACSPLWQVIAGELRERRGAKCDCGTTKDWYAEIDQTRTKKKTVAIIDTCATCGHRETCTATLDKIRKAANAIGVA
jgi:hypothetical protein